MALPQQEDVSPFDDIIGIRIRQARKDLGMTQSELADRLGMSFQQVQKYESGQNKISASRLRQIAEIFGCDIRYLYGISDMPREASPGLHDNDQEGFSYTASSEYERKIMRILEKVPAQKKQALIDSLGSFIQLFR